MRLPTRSILSFVLVFLFSAISLDSPGTIQLWLN